MSEVGARKPGKTGKERAQSFASAIGWVWGALAILFGLATIAAGGAVMIVFGVLLLPPVVRAIRMRVRFMKPFGAPTLFAALLAAVLIGILPRAPLRSERQTDAEATSAAAPATPAPTRRPEPRAEPSAEQRAAVEINAMWDELTRTTQPCDQAGEAASTSLGLARSNPARAYSVVDAAKRTCANVGLDVMGIDPPRSLSRDERRAFDQALNDCGLAYAGKSVMFDRMLNVIDGDRRPSRLAAVEEAAQTSQAQTVQCVLRITALASEQGVVLGED